MRLYVQDRHTEARRFFYGLPTNAASIRVLPAGVKQYASRSRSSQCGALMSIELSWMRLLGCAFALDRATCPFCRYGSLRIIAVIAQEAVLTHILPHLKLATVPPPIAPICARIS